MTQTILIVDDERDMLVTWERLLRARGYRCLLAETGPDAIVLIDSEDPDLVVTDLRLPGADGLAVARHARGRVPSIPVILVSADDSDEVRTSSNEIGISAVLIKPLVNALFLDTIRHVLAGKAPAPAAASDGQKAH